MTQPGRWGSAGQAARMAACAILLLTGAAHAQQTTSQPAAGAPARPVPILAPHKPDLPPSPTVAAPDSATARQFPAVTVPPSPAQSLEQATPRIPDPDIAGKIPDLGKPMPGAQAAPKQITGDPGTPALPAAATSDRRPVHVDFAAGSAVLDATADGALGDVAQRLAADPGLRVQVDARASGKTAAAARRLSLDRALAIRDWLGRHGVDPVRVVVRPLGPDSGSGPLDRADMFMIN